MVRWLLEDSVVREVIVDGVVPASCAEKYEHTQIFVRRYMAMNDVMARVAVGLEPHPGAAFFMILARKHYYVSPVADLKISANMTSSLCRTV